MSNTPSNHQWAQQAVAALLLKLAVLIKRGVKL